MAELSRRFHARMSSKTEFAENLSTMITQYVQSVRSESGELNVKLLKFSRGRGAPLGNRNRLLHGRRTREMDNFRKEVREHIKSVDALIAALEQ
jgi:hypothetical protein